MKKKLGLAALALLLMAAANVHTVCRVSVAGQPVEGLYSPAVLETSRALALRTAEELLPGEERLPSCQVRRSLSFFPAGGDGAVLTDALLRATEGVAVRQEVYVNGLYMGHVEDGEALDASLRHYLYASRPAGAFQARYTGEIARHGVYTREGRDMTLDDMLLLVTGSCPVLYTDEEGRMVLG